MDHTSDPHANKYKIDSTRIDLAQQFKNNPDGPHSPELQKVLQRMRWGSFPGRFVLYVLEPGVRWALAQMPAERGEKVKIFHDVQFETLRDAEWHVFRLRWKLITGCDLDMEGCA